MNVLGSWWQPRLCEIWQAVTFPRRLDTRVLYCLSPVPAVTVTAALARTLSCPHTLNASWPQHQLAAGSGGPQPSLSTCPSPRVIPEGGTAGNPAYTLSRTD
jgi:hypothetical protein